MNKKGFTIVELIAVLILLLIMIFMTVQNIIPSVERNTKKSFLSEAVIISEGARNRYQDDKLKNNFTQDSFFQSNPSKTCYTFENALKNKFVVKMNSSYTGSVEVCHELDCEYQTKIWLTDGEHYLNGVISDGTISKSTISNKFNTDFYLSCGVDPVSLNPSYDFQPIESEQIITIIRDGVYSLEGWGAQGGRHGVYRGGYGGYAYTEVELHTGDKLYINVGTQGTEKKAGYNNAGAPDGGDHPVGGGGATSITTKSGFLSAKVLPDYVYLVAGGGAAASRQCCCCDSSWNIGPSGGGAVSEDLWGTVGQSGNNYGKATFPGSGGGYRGDSGGNCCRSQGGSGFIGNPLTKNGVMYGYNVAEYSDPSIRTISTTSTSSDPISGYAKQGDGYARIKLIDNYYIVYDLRGGTLATPNKTSYSENTDTFTLNNPTKLGYTFTGWTGSNGSTASTSVSVEKGSSGPKHFRANYTPTDYTITYNLNGGSLDENVTNPTTYNIETSTFTLNNPTKAGYAFVGWTGDNGTTPEKTVKVKKGNTGAKTYTAVYEKLYNVTLDYNIANYNMGNEGRFLDTGFIMNYDQDFNITMNINLPSSGTRYLLLGNYDNSKQLNLEITKNNELRAYQSGNRAVSSAITVGEDSECVFDYKAIGKSFTFTYNNTTSDISTSGTLGTSGYTSTSLRGGQDYRGGSTFSTFRVNKLQITSLLSMSYLPTNVSRPGYNFAGWYTAKTGGTKVTRATVPSSDNVTYYARWSYTG